MSSDELADQTEPSSTDDSDPKHPQAVALRAKGNLPNRRGGKPPEGSEERKKRKPGGDRRDRQGFGDGIERAACTHFRHRLPPDFPVQHRTGIAALVPRIVARRTSALLLCDCVHDGPHYWPDGDLAEESVE
jgi:hypothetical protein